MKKIIFNLFIIHCSLIIGNAQWYQQNSGTNQNLYNVKFINKNTGWTLGDAGIILKTTNGGNNWINVPNPSIIAGGILGGLCPVDSNVVYVSGGHEVILKTTNGGTNWIEIRNGPYGTGTGFEAVYFLNKDTGWFCGAMRVLRTTNGGLSFDSAGIFWGSLHDIYFKDFYNGLICGDGRVFKTTDGGMNWFNSNVPTLGYYPMFMRLGVAEKNYIFVSGYNRVGVYKSSDFAATWIKIDSTTTIGAYGIYFTNKNTGFAGSGANMLFRTTNGGFNWYQENTAIGILFFISAINFVNDSVGWYVGGSGKIMHTTTGGQQLVNIPSNIEILIKEFNISQNYPNPFNSETIFKFTVKKPGKYKLEIFNILGVKVDDIFNKSFTEGNFEIKYNAEKLSSGIYFYALFADELKVDTKKLILLK
jgi:photosystem II stability/assembly factor-like uncharacterized protein